MKETSGRTKNNYRAALATLFSFARQKGHLPRGQQTEAEFSTRYNGKGGEIGTYTPKQLQILLSRIEPRMIPFIAIGAFAGLRSAEIARLEWQEVRFDQDVIELKAAKAKTASRRLAPILPALRAWLSPMRKESGKVLAEVHDEFALATQFKKRWMRLRTKTASRWSRSFTTACDIRSNLPDGGSQKCRAGCAGGWEQPANDFRALS